LRKFASCAALCCAFFVLVGFAHAQQFDVNFGGGTLLSSANNLSSLTNPTGSEKGGAYLNVGVDVIPFHRRLGFGFETAWRASQGTDIFGQPYRPILYDFNAMFQPKLGKKAGADFWAGIGAQSVRFYTANPTSCSFFSGCTFYVSSNHFMEHLGAGIRYYVWGHVFVRPEVHYYHVHNNTNDFSSDNLFRVGASIGYTIGPE
jgi:opacity protein-like surface antigen